MIWDIFSIMHRNVSSKIKNVILDSQEFNYLTNQSSTKGVFVIGSVGRNEYLEGWSDLDIVLFVEEPRLNLLHIISKLSRELEEKLLTKVGIEIVDYQIFSKDTKCQEKSLKVKLIKNFYKDNKDLDSNKLYVWSDSFVLFDSCKINKYQFSFYCDYVCNYMYNYISNPLNKGNNKAILRKIIKNILLLIQTYLIYDQQIHVTNFEKAAVKFSSLYNFELDDLFTQFNKRFNWNNLNDIDISNKDIDVLWNCFLNLSLKIKC